MICEHCRTNLATVHTTVIEDKVKVFERHFCDGCDAWWRSNGRPGWPLRDVDFRSRPK